jgi:hypothetical protein
MSATFPSPGRRRFLERAITRDARVPLSADDPEMENGALYPNSTDRRCLLVHRRLFPRLQNGMGTLA